MTDITLMKINEIISKYIYSYIEIFGKIKTKELKDHFEISRRFIDNILIENLHLGLYKEGHYIYSKSRKVTVSKALDVIFNNRFVDEEEFDEFIHAGDVRVIASAIKTNTAVNIRYCGLKTSTIEEKIIYPTRIRKINGAWQFIGYKDKTNVRRDFRFSRIISVKKTNLTFETSMFVDKYVNIYFKPVNTLDAKQKISLMKAMNSKGFVTMKESEIYYFKERYDGSSSISPDRVLQITKIKYLQ
jgi:hypothetical protein